MQLWKLEDYGDSFTFKEDENGLSWEEVKLPIIEFYQERLKWMETLTESEWKETYDSRKRI